MARQTRAQREAERSEQSPEERVPLTPSEEYLLDLQETTGVQLTPEWERVMLFLHGGKGALDEVREARDKRANPAKED